MTEVKKYLESVGGAGHMSALEIIEKLDKSPCVWKEEKDIDTCYVYASGCDNPFEFVDGNPKDNNFKFCPFCGGEIE